MNKGATAPLLLVCSSEPHATLIGRYSWSYLFQSTHHLYKASAKPTCLFFIAQFIADK